MTIIFLIATIFVAAGSALGVTLQAMPFGLLTGLVLGLIVGVIVYLRTKRGSHTQQ